MAHGRGVRERTGAGGCLSRATRLSARDLLRLHPLRHPRRPCRRGCLRTAAVCDRDVCGLPVRALRGRLARARSLLRDRPRGRGVDRQGLLEPRKANVARGWTCMDVRGSRMRGHRRPAAGAGADVHRGRSHRHVCLRAPRNAGAAPGECVPVVCSRPQHEALSLLLQDRPAGFRQRPSHRAVSEDAGGRSIPLARTVSFSTLSPSG